MGRAQLRSAAAPMLLQEKRKSPAVFHKRFVTVEDALKVGPGQGAAQHIPRAARGA